MVLPEDAHCDAILGFGIVDLPMEQIRRLLPYLRRHRRALWVGSFFMALGVVCQLMIPKIAGRTIDLVTVGGTDESAVLLAGGIGFWW